MGTGKKCVRLMLCAGWLLAMAVPARAVILFNNSSQSSAGINRLQTTTERLATDFTTGTNQTLIQSTTLQMFNINLTNDFTAHHFDATIWTEGGSKPGTQVGSFNTFTVIASSSISNGFATAQGGGITLAPNTTYWMVLQIDEAAPNENAGWFKTSSGSVDSGQYTLVAATQVLYSSNSGSTWSNQWAGNELFRFDGLAPEPATLSPLCLIACGLIRRRTARGAA